MVPAHVQALLHRVQGTAESWYEQGPLVAILVLLHVVPGSIKIATCVVQIWRDSRTAKPKNVGTSQLRKILVNKRGPEFYFHQKDGNGADKHRNESRFEPQQLIQYPRAP